MKRISKYTIEYIKEICDQKDLKYINTITRKENKKSRRYVEFICNKHVDKGIQSIVCDKIDKTKKPCKYCNHSKLKEIFKEEMDNINPDIIILSDFVNWDTKIKCMCKKCGRKWDGRVSVLLYGGGCKECGHQKRWDSRGRKTTEDARNEIVQKYPNIRLIGEYNGSHEYTFFKCLLHDKTWESTYSRVLNGDCKCPLCATESIRRSSGLTTLEFSNRISKDYPHISFSDNYINRETEMKFYCTIHNKYFDLKPKYLLAHKVKGCPICSQSLGETKMLNILKELGFDIKEQYQFDDCRYYKPLRFDGYDMNINTVFEYQGEQHYRPIKFNGISSEKSESDFKINLKRDNIKRQYCKSKNIKMIEVPYWEYDNMATYLKTQLGIKE